MGIDDFIQDEKTSSPTDSDGPSEGAIDEFLDKNSDDDSIEIEGGFTIDSSDRSKDTEVVKLYGGPGCGKTTTMVGNTNIDDFSGILEGMFKRRSPDNVMLIAYTRAAADEAKERLVSLTDVSKSKADDRITTIHSMAMKYNNLGPKDIVEIRWSNDKYNFCNEVGLEYQFDNTSDDGEMLSAPDDQGHLLFDMLSWLKSKLKPPEEYTDCPLSSAWEYEDEKFVELAEEWEEYKNDKGIWEFDDAIMESVNNEDTVNAKELFIDEVQDLKGQVEALHNARSYLIDEVEELEERVDSLEQRIRLLEAERDE